MEKEKSEGRETLRGEVQVEDGLKILEIDLRRINPTVPGAVIVQWAVMISDMRGQLRPVTKGQRQIVMEVGIPTQLESNSFSVKTIRFDRDIPGRDNKKFEQEIVGYAILILNEDGQEIASKFQPKSLEGKARKVMP